jgi:outer membrane protein assembly factor BamA
VKRAALLLQLAVACGGSPTQVASPLPEDTKPAGPPPQVAWSELVGDVKEITVKSEDATQVAAIKQTLAPELGKPIDRKRLRGELASMLGTKSVADATASAVQLEDGVELIVTVTQQPALHALTAHEATGAGGAELPLPSQLATATGLPLDPGLLDAVVTQLREQYLAKGFTDVRATWKQTPAGKQTDVAIEVTPGAASSITTIEMKGNAHAKKADLMKAIGTNLTEHSPWSAAAVDHAALALTAYYYDRGYLTVVITPPTPAGTSTPAVFSIIEGDQYRIGKLTVTNANAADAAKYIAFIGAKAGDVFNRSKLQAGILKIQESIKAQVEPVTKLDPKKKTIEIELQLPRSP